MGFVSMGTHDSRNVHRAKAKFAQSEMLIDK